MPAAGSHHVSALLWVHSSRAGESTAEEWSRRGVCMARERRAKTPLGSEDPCRASAAGPRGLPLAPRSAPAGRASEPPDAVLPEAERAAGPSLCPEGAASCKEALAPPRGAR
ncbi:unnamed protein product [Prorocentrum cordatum]|uniref:Uncharacterized protein n=1 Tax=Prorocentrum cordatum TaxID=2364126 RepID=A0ABN9SD66_9DINO|nr:unnamed protein product [Polarella glacialis]